MDAWIIVELERIKKEREERDTRPFIELPIPEHRPEKEDENEQPKSTVVVFEL